MIRWILILSACVVIVLMCLGCASHLQQARRPVTPSVVEEPSAVSPTPVSKLPEAYGPLAQNSMAFQQVKRAFQNVESLRDAQSFSAKELSDIKRSHFASVKLTGCDLEILKALVASDLAPLVIHRSPVGPMHVRAVIGYEDPAGVLILSDSMNYSQMRIEYSEFSKLWIDPQKSCLIISTGVNDAKIRGILSQYIPKEKIDSINIDTQAR